MGCHFLEEISSLSHSIVFLYFFALVTEEDYLSLLFGTLHSNGCIFSPLPFTSVLFTAICKAASDNLFAFLHFFFLGTVLITASCTMSRTSVHSSLGPLSISSNPLNLFAPSILELNNSLNIHRLAKHTCSLSVDYCLVTENLGHTLVDYAKGCSQVVPSELSRTSSRVVELVVRVVVDPICLGSFFQRILSMLICGPICFCFPH